ncbi:YihY/virulence factor BrkB family protein [Ectobacillus sp. sgz5001026]|uniref:YihY/virulence factor BrkB family protein n=1 Tax=Ectobacillus sp. sgz5001026 TaxID=3242473 RepID=UPI0036D3F8A2
MYAGRKINKIVTFFIGLYGRTKKDDVAGLASQLAYFFLLSLFPALVFLLTIVGYLPLESQDILLFLKQYIPSDAMKVIETNVTKIVQNQNGGLLSFGLLGTLWAASNGINSIMYAFNRAYDRKETRPFYITRAISIVLTIAMVFIIMFALALPVFGKLIGSAIYEVLQLPGSFLEIWGTLRLVLSFFVLFFVFAFLYKFAPNRKLHPKEVMPGAAFASVGWVVVSYLFAFYVERFGNYASTYGSLGGIIVLMLWFYFTAWVILLGGELNAMIYSGRHTGSDYHTKTKD